MLTGTNGTMALARVMSRDGMTASATERLRKLGVDRHRYRLGALARAGSGLVEPRSQPLRRSHACPPWASASAASRQT